MNKLKQNQRGAASLITVILLSVILSIVVTGLLRLSVQDARQATDDDLTNRAFYAAESGLADAQRFIEKALDDSTYALKGDDCVPSEGDGMLAPGQGFDSQYICQLIDMQPESITNTIAEDGVVQIPLVPAAGGILNGIVIRWHSFDGDSGDGLFANLQTVGAAELPAKNAWTDAPAMLRANLFSTPKTGSFGRDAITNVIGFLTPTSTGVSSVALSGLDAEVIDAACVMVSPGFDGYACEATITNINFVNNDYELRISPLYRGAQVEVRFTNGTEFIGAQALVDVTGRAADVYRRVQASINLNDSSAQILPNSAILSADSICKKVTISNSVSYGCSY